MNHEPHFYRTCTLFHSHYDFEFICVSNMYSRLQFTPDSILNVCELIPHSIHHTMLLIHHWRTCSLILLFRVCILGFRLILDCFEQFLFLCSIETICKFSTSLHFHFMHYNFLIWCCLALSRKKSSRELYKTVISVFLSFNLCPMVQLCFN